MSTTVGGTPTAARTTGRRWLRSLTVILSSLALVLGLAPAVHAAIYTGKKTIDGDYDVTLQINDSSPLSQPRPGGFLHIDVTNYQNKCGRLDTSTVLWQSGIRAPGGWTHHSRGGHIEAQVLHRSPNWIGGRITDMPFTGIKCESRNYWMKLNIPNNARGGQVFQFGAELEKNRLSPRWAHADDIVRYTLPAVETNISPLTFSPNPGRPGEPVTATARVNATYGTNTPTGTVRFVVEGQTYTANVVNGVATAQITRPTAGTKSVTANFTPTNSTQWRTSSTTGTFNLDTESTQTNLTLETVQVTAGGTVNATAAVTPADAQGDVEFEVAGKTVRIAVVNGRAEASIPVEAAGEYTVNARFIPTNPQRYSESSDTETVVVSAEATETSLAISPTSALVGDDVTLTATVSPAAEGTMTFVVNDETVEVPVADGKASITRQFDANGQYPATASFTPGDPTRYGPSSDTGTVVIDLRATATELTLDPVTVTAGGQVSASAQVTPAGVAGHVVFTVAGQERRVAVDEQGRATADFQLDAAGTHTVTATFEPADATSYAESSDEQTVTVELEGTTTEVTVAPTVARVGEPTTLTATVAPTAAAGTVTFEVDGEEYPAVVVDGVATATHTFSTTGEHPVKATFTPTDTDRYATSTATATATVSAEATQTDLTLSEVEMTAGGTLTVTAEVNPAGAAGEVVFTVDGQTKRVPLTGGRAEAEFQLDATGTHTVTATFEPTNPARYTSSSDSETVSVESESTQTSVEVSPVPARVGEPATLRATVSPAGAAGTVTFEVDDEEYTVEVADGVATATHTFTENGTYPVRATFTPAHPDRYAGSSGTAQATVSAEATATDVTVTPTRVAAGESVEFTATVTPADAAGTVTFTLDGVSRDVEVTDGMAVATFPVTSGGEKTVTAEFTPADAQRYAPSEDTATFSALSEITTTDLTVSPVSARAGQEVELTATVEPAGASGTVAFTIGDDTVEVDVVDGVARHTATFATTGEHTVRATFTPHDTTRYAVSTDTATVVVSAEATSTQVVVDPVRAVAGDEVTVTARVNPAGAAGTVTFDFGDGTTSEPVTVTGGVATTTHTYTEAGDYEITGSFTPTDPERYSASEDTTNVFVTPEPVEQAGTTISLAPVTGAVAGQPVDITATVGPEGVAGEVRFTIDGRTMVVPVTNGEAVLSHTFATDGDHPVKTEFVPTDREAYAGSVDTATVTVAPAPVDPGEPGDPEEPGFPPTTGSAGSIGDLFFWLPGTKGTLGSHSGSLGSSRPAGSSLPTLASIGS
ncbi:Ig-like domain repeat protein [Dietzia sp. 179-F 9C3 NHS]|uniref:Ig-like domain repeat protein n=1 Tax=Dietzia sp. 179-F 9C3 NHS TaxID=3374295 RepID=UPI003879CA5F